MITSTVSGKQTFSNRNYCDNVGKERVSVREDIGGNDFEACRVQQNGKDEETMHEFLVKYRGRVYDIRDFLKNHPGGRKVLSGLRNSSLDKAFDNNPHSKSAFHMFEEFALRKETERSSHEDLIDWRKPLLNQVGKLADQYWEWVNLPVNRSVRLFQDNVLENLTITPWYLVPAVWCPICIYFVYLGFAGLPSKLTEEIVFASLISYVWGILLWTLLEYILHRKLFHFKPPDNSRILITLHFLLHGVHHKAPFDGRRLLFPPVPGMIVATLLWEVYKQLFSQTMVPFIAAGTTTGYVCYDLTHYYLHHGAPTAGSYLYRMKRSHNYHHFLHHDKGFGISSTLWDLAFGTDIPLRLLSKPIEW